VKEKEVSEEEKRECSVFSRYPARSSDVRKSEDGEYVENWSPPAPCACSFISDVSGSEPRPTPCSPVDSLKEWPVRSR
jgi:hypothetical protein